MRLFRAAQMLINDLTGKYPGDTLHRLGRMVVAVRLPICGGILLAANRILAFVNLNVLSYAFVIITVTEGDVT